MRDTKNLVNALRRCAGGSLCKCCKCELYCEKNCVGVLKNAAADLIENQQRHIEAQAPVAWWMRLPPVPAAGKGAET
jgi:hypothetical protein